MLQPFSLHNNIQQQCQFIITKLFPLFLLLTPFGKYPKLSKLYFFSLSLSHPFVILHGSLIPDASPQLGCKKDSVFSTQSSTFKPFSLSAFLLFSNSVILCFGVVF